jgi:tetratricopeptide (TPR) repeat protein
MKYVYTGLVLFLSLLQLNVQAQNSELKKLEAGLYIFKPQHHQLKVLVAEFDNYMAIVEFPVNDTLVNSIIDCVKHYFPDKPIKYVFHSHHHQHAASGFDPFIQSTNAYLVTSHYNYTKIKELTRDTLALKERYISNDSVFKLQQESNELQLFLVKKADYPVPTEEYNLVYLPKQKTLVSGCLYQKPFGYHQVVNDRKMALKSFISDQKMDVRYFVPTNTSKECGFEDICTIEMLDSTLIYGIKPDEVADDFQSRSFDYLISHQDSLREEIRKIPTYYDYYQCGKTLMKRKAYDRALLIFEMLPEIYSDFSHNVYLYSGDCYKFKGDKEKAKVNYEKYIACAIADVEVQWGKERIEKLNIE